MKRHENCFVKIRQGGRMETYLTIDELAEYLKLAEQTIRRWVLNREIPYHKIKKVIRFRVSEIEKWIDKGGLVNTDENAVELQGRTRPGFLKGFIEVRH
jgi:excisionase family DNA binding protein